MRFIHTSDWHLGQIFMGKSREEEHEKFLNWLSKIIKKEKIPLLIVSGDIFDTASPPIYAQKLYFNFLSKLSKLSCKAVITAGNHDSISFLEASKEILSFLNAEVITKEGKVLEFEEISLLAVPFLKEKFLLKALKKEGVKREEERFINAIKEHYENLIKKADKNKKIVATGHLSVIGSEPSGSEKEIYIGNLSSIEGEFFKNRFYYTALGHFHKKQEVSEGVLYSGSPIPLNFNEARYGKSILLIDTKDEKPKIKEIKVPFFKELISVKTSFLEMEEKLKKIKKGSWVEIILTGDEKGEFIYQELERISKEKDIEILAVKYETSMRKKHSTDKRVEMESLTPLKVFQKRIENEDISQEMRKKLENLFLKIAQETELDFTDENQ